MYACKNTRDKKEYAWFIKYIEDLRSVDNGNYEQSTIMLNQMLEAFWDDYGSNNRHIGDGLGRRSNDRDVRTTYKRTDFRPCKALLNCLRNIQEIRERNERNRVAKYSDSDSEGNPLSEGQTLRSERGNGYDGYSMSNNARAAYAEGEHPLSKWSKKEILDAVIEINPDIDCSRLTLETLKDRFLTQSSWHHTSMFYNATGFYSIDEDYNTPCVVLSKPPYVCNVCVRRRKCKADRAC